MEILSNKKSKKYKLQIQADLIETFSKMEKWGADELSKIRKICDLDELREHEKEERLHSKMLSNWFSQIKEESYNHQKTNPNAGLSYLKKLRLTVLKKLRSLPSKKTRLYAGYIIMSYLIEIRAVSVYQDLLEMDSEREKENKILIKILADEMQHLSYLKDEFKLLPIKIKNMWEEFLVLEETLFRDLQKKLK